MWAALSGEYNWQVLESSRGKTTGFARGGRNFFVRPYQRLNKTPVLLFLSDVLEMHVLLIKFKAPRFRHSRRF